MTILRTRLSSKVLLLTGTLLVAAAFACSGEVGSTEDAAAGPPGGSTGEGASGQGGNGVGAGIAVGGAGAVPKFETDIVPILASSCGSGDNSCHSRIAYGADASQDCRGWLSLEDAAIGSKYYDGPNEGADTGCPDMELYDRLIQLAAWEECNNVEKKYVVPCDVEASYLFDKIDDGPYCADPSEKMPPDEDLDPAKKEIIRAWILAGAPRVDGTGVDCDPGEGGAGGGSGGSGPGPQDPIPVIDHPGDMETRPADVPVPFIGSANDPQDGALPGSALVWTSDLDGEIGTGSMFNAPLSVGTHVVTLTATDSDGNEGTASVTLFME